MKNKKIDVIYGVTITVSGFLREVIINPIIPIKINIKEINSACVKVKPPKCNFSLTLIFSIKNRSTPLRKQ